MTWYLHEGDAREILAELPEKSVQCVVTSPPYWGLRDYGLPPSVWGGDPDCEHEWGGRLPAHHPGQVPDNKWKSNKDCAKGQTTGSGQFCQKCGAWLGCLGLEPTPEMFVEHMVEVFRGVWRVLREDGTVWLNLGDSYVIKHSTGTRDEDTGWKHGEISKGYMGRAGGVGNGRKPKDLTGIPWMVAFALRADGWYLRSDIIWSKPNPMPESVTDRPTKAHEYIFLMTKKQKYFYDAEAVREKGKDEPGTHRGGSLVKAAQGTKGDAKVSWHNHGGGIESILSAGYRNKRSVWTVATKPYPEAHFATFPPKLIEPCILAGTSPKACEVCGAPWERVVERKRMARNELEPSDPRYRPNTYKGAYADINGKGDAGYTETITTGWQPTCKCENEGKGRSVVLDPFAGSGTTLFVAEQHGRDSIGIELSKEYCKLIRKRMDNMQQNIFGLGVTE